KGNVPPDLTAADFVLLEDGKPQQIIGVSYPVRRIAAPQPQAGTAQAPTPAAPPLPAEKRWQVVIYIQQSLSSTHGLSEALKSLASHAEELTALGDVSIVGDEGPTPHVIAPATNNGATLRNTLLDLVPKIRGLEEVTRLRMQYLNEPGSLTRAPQPSTSASNRSPGSSSIRALVTARLEAQIVRLRQEAMLTWTARFQEPGRQHALLVVTSGYDLNPYDFYASSDPSTEQELRSLSAAPRQAEIAQALTANGWTILSFAPEWMETAFSPTFDVTNSGRGRLNDFKAGKNDVATPIALNVHPLDALRTLAEESGGSVQTSAVNLTKDLDQLANRLVLTYQLHRPRDGRPHRIEVRSLRPGLTARVQHSVVAGTPEALAVARASLLASDEGERGELPVRCTVRELAAPKKGKDLTSQLEAFVSLAPIDPVRPGLTAATLRFSVSVNTAGAPPVTMSKRMENLDLSKQANWRIDFQVQHSPGATIGIVAEEMATGAWGGTRCAADGAATPAAAPSAATERDLSLPLSGRWKTLAAATAEAQAKGALILLDSRGASADPDGDRWIASLEALPAAARILDGMVLAASGGGTQGVAASRGRRHLMVLDPWGGTILEPDEGFGDRAKFAFALNALVQQAPAFIRAAKARQEGKIAQSQLLLAGGLLDAGAAENASELFRQAYAAAKLQNDTETMQKAQLGIAALDAQSAQKAPKAVHDLEEITAHPANSEIASSAWMLLGHIHRGRIGETKAAIAAYQKSFALAPKPSPLAEAARRHLETLGSEPESEVRAAVAAGNVHLVYPHREVMVGNVDFGVSTPSDASRVEVFLDDARVAELTRPPFRTTVSLGPSPHVRTIRAVAYDAHERRLGEESVTLNDRPVSLGVTIVAPASDAVASTTVVEVKPRLPQGSHLAGIDLYWNETKIATLTAPPFRHELVLPSPSATGFIRAVARADDGTSAEDVKMINAGGVAEQMRVDAVQVYAIVQDRHGHYVDGLTASDFVVKEDGRTVTARVQSGKDDPISIGIALDTSSSMQVAMSEVIDFANEFVSHSLGAADQTFVTAFDEEPRLVQPLTNNRKEVTASIYGVHANGGTAIWDALLYSLQQFHGVPGKRALVVFTDAVNNAGSATPKGVLQYAREVGVPVYVVQIFTGARSPSPMLVNPRSGIGRVPINQMTSDERNIENLAASTGGAFFRFVGKKDLPHIFSQIRDDTRGQYLLTYVSPSTKPRAELRRITVEVPGKAAVVRATSSYYPR
ncbi:MAG TPA: VWA domain-containing protein, partial [Thermoanaerobaculia bacterium]